MQLFRFRFASDWQAGTLLHSALDTLVNVDQWGHPAVENAIAPTTTVTETGAQAVGTTQPAGTGLPTISQSNTQGHGTPQWAILDTLGETPQPGDTLSMTGTWVEVAIQFTGLAAAGAGLHAGASGLQANTVRQGGIAAVIVDGDPNKTYYVDTWQAAPECVLHLDGNSHTIQVQHSGGYNSAATPIGPVTAGTGSSVANTLQVAAVYHPAFAERTYRITAASSSTYNVEDQAHGSSSWTSISTGRSIGSANTSDVPGCSLSFPSGTALTTGDTATFTTDPITVAVESIVFGTGTGGVSEYQSPIMDSGDPNTRWLLAEWEEGAPLGAYGFLFAAGDTPRPDQTWNFFATLTPVDQRQPVSGILKGYVGLARYPRGRYGYFVVQFPSVSTTVAWVRNLRLYAFNPLTDSYAFSKLALPQGVAPGNLMVGYLGGLISHVHDLYQDVLDQIESRDVTKATDAYLYGMLADLDLTPYPGVPPEVLQTIVATAYQSRQEGGSLPFIQKQVSALVGLACTVANTSGGQYQVTVPPPPYPNLASLPVPQAQGIIKDFVIWMNPVGSVITPGTPLGAPNPTTVNVTFL